MFVYNFLFFTFILMLHHMCFLSYTLQSLFINIWFYIDLIAKIKKTDNNIKFVTIYIYSAMMWIKFVGLRPSTIGIGEAWLHKALVPRYPNGIEKASEVYGVNECYYTISLSGSYSYVSLIFKKRR